MLKNLKWFAWMFILTAVSSASLNAQTNFVYTNNDLVSGNSISAFSVDASGSLGELTSFGSPFLTGGLGAGGGSYSASRIIVVNNFLYAANAGGSGVGTLASVSAFTINTTTNPGALVAVPGSPFDTDGRDGSPSGVSLAATPDGAYLYAGTTGLGLQFNLGTITIFSIDPATGALSKQDSVAAGGPMYSMKVSPNGKFLLLSFDSGCGTCTDRYGVEAFAIQSDGSLQTPPVSSLMVGPNPVTSLDINCVSNRIYAGLANLPQIDVIKIDTDGTLSLMSLATPGSSAVGSYQGLALSHPDANQILFASNPGGTPNVAAFSVGAGGSLTFIGSETAAGSSGQTVSLGPGGLALSHQGNFLYAADASVGGLGAITIFGVTSSSVPSFDSLTFTNRPLGLRSLAAYPANVCSATPNGATAKLTVTKTLIPSADPRRFNLQINGTTLATNVGDGGTTGPQDGVVGSNTVGETVGTPGTSLSDFNVVIGGECAADGTITLAAGDNRTCTITNTRKLPTLTGINPTSAIVGGLGFSMSLTGANFGADSTAQFDGSDLTTHFASPDTTHLTADIPASDLTTVGQFSITVHNSLATVGSSSSLTLTVSYKFLGLFTPYASPPRSYRVDSSIPLRWQYAAADGTPVPSPEGNPLVQIYPAAGCGNAITGDVLAASAPGNSGYQYHAPSRTWQFNLKVGGNMVAGCYVIFIKSQQTGQTDGPFPIQLVQ